MSGTYFETRLRSKGAAAHWRMARHASERSADDSNLEINTSNRIAKLTEARTKLNQLVLDRKPIDFSTIAEMIELDFLIKQHIRNWRLGCGLEGIKPDVAKEWIEIYQMTKIPASFKPEKFAELKKMSRYIVKSYLSYSNKRRTFDIRFSPLLRTKYRG